MNSHGRHGNEAYSSLSCATPYVKDATFSLMSQEIYIAVVDDTLSILDVTALMLEDAGFHPRTYCNAILFIDSLQNEQPSLVLLDLMMPGMNGIECLERLSALGVCFPILMYTAVDDDHYRARALQLGAKAYVTKDELLSKPKEIINKYLCSV